MSASIYCMAFGGAAVTCPPGHTMPSLRKAIEIGANCLYVEVRMTRDREMVAWTSRQRLVGDETVHLVDYNLADWRRITQKDEAPIVAVEEVLALVARTGIGIALDLCAPGMETSLARMLRRFRIPYSRLLVVTTTDASLTVLRSLDPKIPLANRLARDHANVTGAQLLAVDADAVVWPGSLITPQVSSTLKQRGIAVYAGPVFLGEEMRRLRDSCEVDGIMTPHPELLLTIFDKSEIQPNAEIDAILDAA